MLSDFLDHRVDRVHLGGPTAPATGAGDAVFGFSLANGMGKLSQIVGETLAHFHHVVEGFGNLTVDARQSFG